MTEAQPEPPFVNLVGLSIRTGLPVKWLKGEALAGRIPCLLVGRKLYFNVAAVEEAVGRLAAAGRHPAAPPEVTPEGR